MESTQLDFGKIIVRILILIIVKPFILPFRIYKNALQNLSNSDDKNSNQQLLDSEFPFYIWLIDLFDAVIALIYPIGVCVALYTFNNESYRVEEKVFTVILATYFFPLIYGFVKELFSITLKSISYLKIISKK